MFDRGLKSWQALRKGDAFNMPWDGEEYRWVGWWHGGRNGQLVHVDEAPGSCAVVGRSRLLTMASIFAAPPKPDRLTTTFRSVHNTPTARCCLL